MRNNFLLFAFGLLLISGQARSQAPAPAPSSTNADALYLESERSFLRDDLESALRDLNLLLTRHRSAGEPGIVSRALNLRGLVNLQLKNNLAAVADFEAAVSLAETHFAPTDQALHLARYNLANGFNLVEENQKAAQVLAKIEPKLLDQDTRIRFYNLLGNTLAALERLPTATIAFLLTANELETSDSIATDALVRKAFNLSKRLFSYNALDDLEQLDAFEARMAANGIGTWTLRLIMARGYSILGKRSRAEQLLTSFLESVPTHPLANDANAMNELFQRLAQVEPTKIGVLLPLSGNFSKYGQLSLNSVIMAINAYNDMRNSARGGAPANSPVTIVVRDSGESTESALKAFDQLAADDHVVAVIGPLLSRQALAVAQKAQEYGVPIFSLSQKQGLEKMGSFVFPIALTPSQQIQTLIQFAMKQQGFRRFAILAPDSAGGEEYVRLFWDQVEANGGVISGYETYRVGSTDFRAEIRKLVGLHYPDSRKLEMEDLKRREELYAPRIKAKGALRKRLLQSLFRPKPILDFDAIFIPDGPQAIGQIAPAFAVYDAKQVPFLGINTWNTPEVVRRAGQYLQNSYFVDTFFPTARSKPVAAFVNDFSRHFGTVPGTLEVQAFDATRIIVGAIESGNISSRSDLVNYILSKKMHQGISGQFHFSPNGLERSAYLLGVKGSEILEIMPPSLVR